MNLRRFALLIVSAAVVIGAAAYAFRAPLSMAVAQRVAASRLAADTLNDLPDGLHVGLCGAGSPMPDDRRMGACTVVVAGQRLFVFDTGNGSARNVGKLGFVHGRIEAIFLTHFHSDHIDGLGELLMQRWVSTGNAAPVPLYGPPGVEKVVAGFMQAYEQDRHYRVAQAVASRRSGPAPLHHRQEFLRATRRARHALRHRDVGALLLLRHARDSRDLCREYFFSSAA